MNRRWTLAMRPSGAVTESTFVLQRSPIPTLQAGEVLVRNRMLSIDPANRAWLFPSPTYKAPVAVGETMHGFAFGEVLESRSTELRPGDSVEGMMGWQEYAVVPACELTRRQAHIPPEHALGVLGVTGLTAYFGLLDVGRLKAGKTVVVSAAAGAVGSVACQIAKVHGCRVIGIAGGPEKCGWLKEAVGVDVAVDYKAGALRSTLRSHCPEGIDLYFDNTGGDALTAALSLMRLHGRIVCCGNLSQYNTDRPAPGPVGVPGLLVTKRLRMEGFIVLDYFHRREEAEAVMKDWLASGTLRAFETIVDGLEAAPAALTRLFEGYNRGKLLVRL